MRAIDIRIVEMNRKVEQSSIPPARARGLTSWRLHHPLPSSRPRPKSLALKLNLLLFFIIESTCPNTLIGPTNHWVTVYSRVTEIGSQPFIIPPLPFQVARWVRFWRTDFHRPSPRCYVKRKTRGLWTRWNAEETAWRALYQESDAPHPWEHCRECVAVTAPLYHTPKSLFMAALRSACLSLACAVVSTPQDICLSH